MSIEQRAFEKGTGIIVDEFAVEFLAGERRAAIETLQFTEERRREKAGIGDCGGAAQHGLRVGDHLLEQRQRPRRRSDGLLRALAQAEGELQRVPGFFNMTPFRQLIAPGQMELRPAEKVGGGGGKELSNRSIAEDDLAARGHITRPVGQRMHGKEA